MPGGISEIIGGVGAVGSLISGIVGLFGGDKLPPELEEYINLLRVQAKEGIPYSDEVAMRQQGSRQIAGQVGSMQRRGAASLASRGVSDSSAANEMIGGVNRTQAEMFSDLQHSIRTLDEQTKQQAMAQLGGATAQATAYGQQRGAGIAGMLSSGLAGLANEDLWVALDLMDEPMSEMEKWFQMFQKYMGSGYNNPTGTPYEPPPLMG